MGGPLFFSNSPIDRNRFQALALPAMKKRVVIKKYGGTSVGTIERIENVAARILREFNDGQLPVVVVSAMSGETNRLVGLAQQIDPLYRGPAYDLLVASGEQVSVGLVSMALEKLGLKTQPLLAFQLGIETDSVYSKARIKNIQTQELERCISAGIIPVIAGFQGIDENLNVTTLGRGGSDTTAVAIAAAVHASECEIYTDVPAVFSADPRMVPMARELSRLSYDEMMEMAALGSKVLHIRCVEIGAKYNVRIHLRSTFEERPGTWIVPEGEIMEQAVVSSVTHDPNTIVFKLFPVPPETSFLSQLFTSLAEKGVVVDIITQSQSDAGQRLAFSVTQEDFPLAESVLSLLLPENKVTREVMPKMAKVSVVGVGMRNHPGVAARFFTVLAKHKIQIHLVTTSEIKISAVIDEANLQVAAQALHHAFELDGNS
jgi:aspartate kinase